LQNEIAAAIAGLSMEETRWHEPEKWCIGEILEHLYLTYTGTIKGFGRLMDSGTPQASAPTRKQRVRAFVVVGLGYLPSGWESPKVARPRGIPSEKVMAEVGGTIAEMDAVMGRCAKQFGKRKKVLDHPLLGPFSVQQWSKFHLVHGRHHIKQIRRLREKMRSSQFAG
jgi:hypothetical protein